MSFLKITLSSEKVSKFYAHIFPLISVLTQCSIAALAVYLFYLFLRSSFGFLFIPYLTWMIYDNVYLNTPCKGGRLQLSSRRSPVWKKFANFFPCSLHKTVDLSAQKNYLFTIHPHGVFGWGGYLNMATEATGFGHLFPGITVRPATVNFMMWVPLLRELMMVNGVISANKESIEYALTEFGPGSSVALWVGGALEAVYALPNRMDLILKSRKGFARLAIRTGATLVPCLTFGENEIFNQKFYTSETLTGRLQKWFYSIFRVSFLIIHGRGLLSLRPNRVPIHTIVGSPIETIRNPNPTEEEVDQLHKKYLKELQLLFEDNKGKYGKDSNMEMTFI